MIPTIEDWLKESTDTIKTIFAEKLQTVVIYANGTRRWFSTRGVAQDQYFSEGAAANRNLCDMVFAHGAQSIIQPMFGQALLKRSGTELEAIIRSGFASFFDAQQMEWYKKHQIRVVFYGDWKKQLQALGFEELIGQLEQAMEVTQSHNKKQLLIGLFADQPNDQITHLAQHLEAGQSILNAYYQTDLAPVDLVVGSGHPILWDLPLLNINQANLYFLQFPTYFLSPAHFRSILFDHLFVRTAGDDQYDQVDTPSFQILGLGAQRPQGWIAEAQMAF